MGRAGVGTLRVMFNWGEIQPIQDGPYDFADTDRIAAVAAANGIRLEPFLYGTPGWARDCSGVPAAYCDRVDPLRSAAGWDGWPKFAAAIAARYGSRGTFWSSGQFRLPPGSAAAPALPIIRVQVWNEANSATFFRPTPSATAYHRLLAVTAGAIRGADPEARIVLAGMFYSPPSGVKMPKFLDQLFRISGARSLFDYVAIHPYAPSVEGIEIQIKQARRVMRRRGAAKMRMLITELGWGSAKRKGRGPLYKGSKGQARMLRSAFRMILGERKRHRIDGLFWFSWRDLPAGTAGQCILCESFGLLRAGGGSKPSLRAYARFTGGR